MIGKKRLLGALVATLLGFSTGSFAEQIITASDLIQQPGYQTSWKNMVKGQAQLPGWARKGIGTSTPAETVTWQGQSYQIGNICKPHDCANNFMIVAFKAKLGACGLKCPISRRPSTIRRNTPNINGWVNRMIR